MGGEKENAREFADRAWGEGLRKNLPSPEPPKSTEKKRRNEKKKRRCETQTGTGFRMPRSESKGSPAGREKVGHLQKKGEKKRLEF